MASNQILTNTYIPRKTKKGKNEWYKHDLMTYFDNLKYDKFASDTDSYFQNAQVINFDIINHVCRGTQLQNPENYYKAIRSKDFEYYEHVLNKVISSAKRFERDDINFEHSVLKNHF